MVKYITITFILFFSFVKCTDNYEVLSVYSEKIGQFPQIKINTFDTSASITRDYYLNGHLLTLGNEPKKPLRDSILIKGRGNTTWAFPKRSYQIKLNNSASLYGLPVGKKFVLLANYSDKSMLRNELAFSLSRLSSLDWTPKSKFVELTINEEYLGVYLLTQKIEINRNALSPQKANVLLEVDQMERLKTNDIYFKTNEHLFCVKDAIGSSSNSTLTIKEFMMRAERSILIEKNYMCFFDLLALVDWYLINEIAKNNDGLFNSSVYLHYKFGHKIQMGPVWDYDIAFGNINYNGNDSIQGFFIKKAPYFQKLFNQDLFVILVKERFKYFYNQKEAILSLIDSNASNLQSVVDRNFKKWPILGKYIWPNAQVFNTYDEEVEYLKTWLSDRMDWLSLAYSTL